MQKRNKVLLIVAGILLLLALVYIVIPRQVKMYVLGINSLESLDISPFQRILVFAPHNDDETLGQGGLIDTAIKAGKQVEVVIATNGDGYTFATMEEFRKVFPTGMDYIKLGNIRQEESISALQVLGLDRKNVFFLSYPDRGSPALWLTNWTCDNPYHSPFTNTSRSEYALTYNPTSQYCGEDFLADVQSSIHNFQPDLILYPHPEDAHPDHWGLSNFVRLAITMEEHLAPGYKPETLAYLVHRPGFPTQGEYHPDLPLLPPAKLFQINPDWYQFGLSTDVETQKWNAIQQYKSQLSSLRELLESFVRTNELFARIDTPQLVTGTAVKPDDPSTWKNAAGHSVSPLQLDPTMDFISRDAVPDADITAMYGIIDGNQVLHLCGEMRTHIGPLVTYTIKVKSYGDNGFEERNLSYLNGRGQAGISGAGKYVCAVIKMADLHHPTVIMIGFETHALSPNTIDHIGWIFPVLPQ